MNKHFDKLLFLAALAALLAACGFWYSENAEKIGAHAVKPKTGDVAKPTSTPFTPATPASPVPRNVDWTQPTTDLEDEDAADWTFDLFTPVKIFWSTRAAQYVPKGFTPPPEPPFGIKLVNMVRPAYRLMLKGDLGPTQVIVMDAKGGTTSYLQKGKTYSVPPVTVRDIIAENRNANGTVAKPLTLVVYDTEMKREFRLENNTPVYLDQHVITLRDDAGETWTWQKVGEQRSVPNVGEFTLKAFDFDKNEVTIEKKYKKLNRAKKAKDAVLTEVLHYTPKVHTPAKPPATPAAGATGKVPALPAGKAPKSAQPVKRPAGR
ncbi:MAG: hypothetical protein LBR07_08805 [Puniceicoccales bacterium]|jgi:hypothetical protein|nr:hypothetical protein [Puniceicoccales bacterium]